LELEVCFTQSFGISAVTSEQRWWTEST